MDIQKAQRRSHRVRSRLHGTSQRPRASVHRSNKRMAVQLIDDDAQRTIAAASGVDAKTLGEAIAARAKEAGVTYIVFDRGRYPYHGTVKTLAQTMRDGGLIF